MLVVYISHATFQHLCPPRRTPEVFTVTASSACKPVAATSIYPSPHGSPPSPPPRHGAQHPSQRHQNTACKPHFKPPQRHDGAQIPPRRKPQTTTNEATGNGSNTVTKTTQR
ncbi:hypothetical protein EDB85DRAFT_1893508 [Lactarius pseudohatsudake]|nr:hypothetical protein EDB85DRAFT_1898375 [Lactarius pseudohatsudake]KAH9020026.1 hypothetical protein EDB85DRAFT_1896379 [Lactarius pseudohatsudake]KAH9025732.1 hypothetical protein EDB85DRAFT_1893726 [Lactarius pseudohatsudake]KAH9026195.1 hypothetical protein EDB85DRAFT_1893508 [Lactarius pseudohatsudake]